MHLTLLIPDLLWPEPGDYVDDTGWQSGLSYLLGRTRFLQEALLAPEQCLLQLLGLPETSIAPCRLLGEQETAPADPENQETPYWCCADPVPLQFHQDRILIGPPEILQLTAGEHMAIQRTLNEEFASMGHFYGPHPERGYLALAPGHELPSLPPLSLAVGRQLFSFIPHYSPLAQWMNEVQMLLHAHPVNLRRQANQQPLVNGLWLWGAGRLSAPQPLDSLGGFDLLCSAGPLAQGAARHLGIPFSPTPALFSDLLQHKLLHQEGQKRVPRVLVELSSLQAPVFLEDHEGWKAALSQLDEHWFMPLYRSLGRMVSSLRVVSPTGYGLLSWQLMSRDRWKYWKRPLSLKKLVRQLVESPLDTAATLAFPQGTKQHYSE